MIRGYIPEEKRVQFTWETWILIFAGITFMVICWGLISKTYVHRQPWMNTATLDMGDKGMAILSTPSQFLYVLVPKECVGSDLKVVAGCEDKAIGLPIDFSDNSPVSPEQVPSFLAPTPAPNFIKSDRTVY